MLDNYLLKALSRYNPETWADIIYRNSLLYPNKEAFVFEKERITFAEYNNRVNKLINALYRLNCRTGDVIGILSWNCLKFAEINGVAMKGGFIAAPFNPRLKDSELEFVINNSLAKTVFIGSELVDTVKSIRQRLPNVKHFICLEGAFTDMTSYDDLLESSSGDEPDVIVTEDTPVGIIFTSGTTGVPRGALYTQRRLIEESKTLSLDMGLEHGHKRIQITPLFHIAGNSHFRASLYTGGCNVICKSFDVAQTLRLIQTEKATHMDIVPTHLIAILNHPDLKQYDIGSLKMIFYGGSPMPLEVLKRGMDVFGPIFSQGYGQSESGPAICHLSKEDHRILYQTKAGQKKLNSAGQPYIGVQVRIVDEENKDVLCGKVGEIIVRSNHIMQEYFHNPEATKATIINGWLHTGDLGHYDENGYVFITDRKKDMIISGGENVFPREIEEVLYRHPAVLEAAVIGVPDSYWVERVHAVIVLKKGEKATSEELIAFCKKQIAGYKTPKTVEIVEALPKNSSGKILKRELKVKYRQK